uniref:Uncharacterized protein n=1 Tax=Anguilla anguilla TaxID=7936 RepID=A0A0E9RJS4_ANGAN
MFWGKKPICYIFIVHLHQKKLQLLSEINICLHLTVYQNECTNVC